MTIAMNYHFIIVAITVFFISSVSFVYADSVHIENTVESYMHTGGNTSISGTDGKNGENGTSGADGIDGTDGKDDRTVESSGTATVSVESYVNGEKVLDIHETATRTAEASVVHKDTEQNVAVALEGEASTQKKRTLVAEIIATIRLITAFLW